MDDEGRNWINSLACIIDKQLGFEAEASNYGFRRIKEFYLNGLSPEDAANLLIELNKKDKLFWHRLPNGQLI